VNDIFCFDLLCFSTFSTLKADAGMKNLNKFRAPFYALLKVFTWRIKL